MWSLFGLLVALVLSAHAANDRPIIGIVAWPLHDEPVWSAADTSPPAKLYFPASYVKWVESAGARAVPLLMTQPEAETRVLLRQLNGVLFVGGGANTSKGSPVRRFTTLIFEEVLKANDQGQHLPLWGTCLGFEILSIIIADSESVMSHTSATDVCLPLKISEECRDRPGACRLFGPGTPPSVVDHVAQNHTIYNNHQLGLRADVFRANGRLSSFLRVVSTSRDRDGLEFISTFEARQYPIYAVQWHPEKTQFEWHSETIPHSADAIAASSYVARFFVQEATKNDHRFETKTAEVESLIYNYQPTYTARYGPFKGFMQCYFF